MIGIFDSGLGGLTILKELLKRLPQYGYIYFGDSARVPYGNKSQRTIYNYTREAVDFLFKQGCELVILACNTASANALKKIQREWLPRHYADRRVLGVIIPAAEAAVEQAEEIKEQKNKRTKKQLRVGVVGTWATIKSGIYETELKKLNSDAEIFTKSCPLLVPLVEEGWLDKPVTRMILKKYLRPLKIKKVQSLILGCTHYPFLLKDIKKIMGKNVAIINTSEAMAIKLTNFLKRHPEIDRKLSNGKQRIFYTTDEPGRFKDLGQKFLGEQIKEIKRIEL